MRLNVTPSVRELGIDAVMAVINGAEISNKSRPLEKLKKEIIEQLQPTDFSADPVLQAYYELYQKLGVSEDFTPPAAHLLNLIKRNGRLPNINTVVDCYNLISARTRLSIGAHNLAHIRGDITFRLTDGTEHYIPLGEENPVKVNTGEYACTDAEKIICRLDVKQCQETRITKETSRFMLYVQGNRNTSPDYLAQALLEVCELIKEICGGDYHILAQGENWPL